MKNLKKIECFLLDMDGTLYLDNNPLPGAVRFITALKRAGKKTVFLSNNSSKNSKQYLAKLRSLKIPAGRRDIFTSLNAAVIYMRKRGFRKIFPLARHAGGLGAGAHLPAIRLRQGQLEYFDLEDGRLMPVGKGPLPWGITLLPGESHAFEVASTRELTVEALAAAPVFDCANRYTVGS